MTLVIHTCMHRHLRYAGCLGELKSICENRITATDDEKKAFEIDGRIATVIFASVLALTAALYLKKTRFSWPFMLVGQMLFIGVHCRRWRTHFAYLWAQITSAFITESECWCMHSVHRNVDIFHHNNTSIPGDLHSLLVTTKPVLAKSCDYTSHIWLCSMCNKSAEHESDS